MWASLLHREHFRRCARAPPIPHAHVLSWPLLVGLRTQVDARVLSGAQIAWKRRNEDRFRGLRFGFRHVRAVLALILGEEKKARPQRKDLAPCWQAEEDRRLRRMRLSAFALLSISCCTGLLLPRCRTGLLLPQHTSRLDRLGITTASAAEPSFDELFAQGTAFVQSGNLGKALGCFQGAARLDPSHEPTQKLLAKLEGLGMTLEEEAEEAQLEAEAEEEEAAAAAVKLELSEAVPTTTSKAVTRPETVEERNERVDAALAELGRTGSAEVTTASALHTALRPIT